MILEELTMGLQRALKILKWAWAGRLSIRRGFFPGALTAGLGLGLLLSPPTLRAEEVKQSLVYEVYTGGIHTVQAEVEIIVDPDKDYSVSLDARTRGFLAKLLPWSGRFESQGQSLENGERRPRRHKSVRKWKEEIDSAEYLFNEDGSLERLTIKDHGKAPYERTVEAALTDGTVDILSAALVVFEAYNKNKTCAGSAEVFDGKRRFKQVFTHEKTVELKASKYNIYEGPAAQCTVEVIPVAGKWHKKPRGWLSIQEQGRKLGMMPTLWLAQIEESGPAVPVKIHIKTIYGSMFLHLTEYKSGNGTLMAANRMRRKDL